MTKGEKNKDISDRGRNKDISDRGRNSENGHMRRDMTKKGIN